MSRIPHVQRAMLPALLCRATDSLNSATDGSGPAGSPVGTSVRTRRPQTQQFPVTRTSGANSRCSRAEHDGHFVNATRSARVSMSEATTVPGTSSRFASAGAAVAPVFKTAGVLLVSRAEPKATACRLLAWMEALVAKSRTPTAARGLGTTRP